MALQNFVLNLMENLLGDQELGLREEDIRFYDKGTTAEYINFHVGNLYRLYRKDGMEGVLPIVKRDIKNHRAAAAGSLALLEQFEDYEAIGERLILRPLNLDDNEKALVRGVYRRVGDMALVLYISLGKVGQGGASNLISTMVLRDMFQKWELDEQVVLGRALENTMRLQPPIFIDLTAMLGLGSNPPRVRFMEDESISFDLDSPLAPALFTEQEVNGSIAAFYPGASGFGKFFLALDVQLKWSFKLQGVGHGA